MKRKYWFFILFVIYSINSFGQNFRINNSFIILVNNNLTMNVSAVRLILSDTTGKEKSISAAYLPGDLYVNDSEKKRMLDSDTTSNLFLAFDNYDYRRKNGLVNSYRITISRKWLKESLIVLKITDIDKKRGTYKYSFDIPGYVFGTIVNK